MLVMKQRKAKQVLRLRKLRRDREWTQADVAKRLGVLRTSIAQYENGIAEPSLTKARDLAKIFGVSVEELFEHVEIPA